MQYETYCSIKYSSYIFSYIINIKTTLKTATTNTTSMAKELHQKAKQTNEQKGASLTHVTTTATALSVTTITPEVCTTYISIQKSFE